MLTEDKIQFESNDSASVRRLTGLSIMNVVSDNIECTTDLSGAGASD